MKDNSKKQILNELIYIIYKKWSTKTKNALFYPLF